MKQPFCLRLLLGLAAGLIFHASPLGAAVSTVYIQDYYFSPNTATINVNDSVQWIWQGNYHSATSTSTPEAWPDSGLYNTGHTYSYMFTSAGTFPYWCSYHYFIGSIVVNAASAPPPTVAITSPANGTVLSAPASLTLKANASASGGSVTNVQFFQGTTSLGSVKTAPYSIAVTGLAAGNYTFSAVAANNTGGTATNSVGIKVITPSPNTVGSFKRTSSTGFQFTYGADVGLTYAVQQSSDLRNWNSVNTNTATGAQVLFQDTNASGAARFYRIERLPNP